MHINGTEVVNGARMQEIIARHSPGDRLNVTLVRNGKPMQVSVTLRNRDGNTSVTLPETPMGVLGATFKAADKDLLKKLEITRGVQVTITGKGSFSQAGINDGFIITTINGMKINSPEDIDKIFNSLRELSPGEGDKVMFISGIYPTGKQAYYAVPLTD